MIKLPVCPYCHTVYGYKEVMTTKGKTNQCYHCQKEYKINRSLRAIPVITACVVMIIVNLIILHTSRDFNLGVITAMDIIVIFISLLISPYMIRFQETEQLIKPGKNGKSVKTDHHKKSKKQ